MSMSASMSASMQERRAASKEASASTNTNGQIYGMSRYIQPTDGSRLLAEAEFENFAPCGCIINEPCVPDKARKRHYVRLYENRLEINNPSFPCLCLSKERCIEDYSRNYFFDQQPNRVGMICHFIPMVCLGPPVVYNHIPRFCGVIDARQCCGETIFYSPCNCYNLKCCICCGKPCFTCWSYPLVVAMKNGEDFLGKWKTVLEAYARDRVIPEGQYTEFQRVADRFCDCDSSKYIPAVSVEAMDRGDGAKKEVMDRGGDDPSLPEAYAVPVPEATIGSAKDDAAPRSTKSAKSKKKKSSSDATSPPTSPKKKKKKKKKATTED